MTANIDLILVGAIMGAIITFCLPIIFVVKSYYKIISSIKSLTLEMKKSRAERAILLQGVKACLMGLKEHGCNGPVIKGILDIERFVEQQLHCDSQGVEK